MSFSPRNESAFNDTKMRSGKVTPCSGMCSFCTAECVGTCEVGLAAILGKAAVYPTNTGNNQIASEKDNPIDYSIFNINGRCFSALGKEELVKKSLMAGAKSYIVKPLDRKKVLERIAKVLQ